MSLVEDHFDSIARDYDRYKSNNAYYYANLKKVLSRLIPIDKNVMEIGCGTGDLLVSLKPRKGLGVDISSEMIKIAKWKWKKKKNISFRKVSLKESINNRFDYIFMSDVVEHLEDPEKMFQYIAKIMNSDAVFVNTMANPLWEPILVFAERLNMKMPEGSHQRITIREFEQLIRKSGLEIVDSGAEVLLPIDIPWFSEFVNKYIAPFTRQINFIHWCVAKKI